MIIVFKIGATALVILVMCLMGGMVAEAGSDADTFFFGVGLLSALVVTVCGIAAIWSM